MQDMIGFNRYIVECKYELNITFGFATSRGFNRYIVECKYKKHIEWIGDVNDLIDT